jgi:hypothetical protein
MTEAQREGPGNGCTLLTGVALRVGQRVRNIRQKTSRPKGDRPKSSGSAHDNFRRPINYPNLGDV